MGKVNIGFDIGSVSINTVVCNEKGKLIEELPYCRHFGKTLEICSELLKQIEKPAHFRPFQQILSQIRIFLYRILHFPFCLWVLSG